MKLLFGIFLALSIQSSAFANADLQCEDAAKKAVAAINGVDELIPSYWKDRTYTVIAKYAGVLRPNGSMALIDSTESFKVEMFAKSSISDQPQSLGSKWVLILKIAEKCAISQIGISQIFAH